ncbi:hypothetical protein HGRIS_006953 [Hohenbuehelia grisea]
MADSLFHKSRNFSIYDSTFNSVSGDQTNSTSNSHIEGDTFNHNTGHGVLSATSGHGTSHTNVTIGSPLHASEYTARSTSVRPSEYVNRNVLHPTRDDESPGILSGKMGVTQNSNEGGGVFNASSGYSTMSVASEIGGRLSTEPYQICEDDIPPIAGATVNRNFHGTFNACSGNSIMHVTAGNERADYLGTPWPFSRGLCEIPRQNHDGPSGTTVNRNLGGGLFNSATDHSVMRVRTPSLQKHRTPIPCDPVITCEAHMHSVYQAGDPGHPELHPGTPAHDGRHNCEPTNQAPHPSSPPRGRKLSPSRSQAYPPHSVTGPIAGSGHPASRDPSISSRHSSTTRSQPSLNSTEVHRGAALMPRCLLVLCATLTWLWTKLLVPVLLHPSLHKKTLRSEDDARRSGAGPSSPPESRQHL